MTIEQQVNTNNLARIKNVLFLMCSYNKYLTKSVKTYIAINNKKHTVK